MPDRLFRVRRLRVRDARPRWEQTPFARLPVDVSFYLGLVQVRNAQEFVEVRYRIRQERRCHLVHGLPLPDRLVHFVVVRVQLSQSYMRRHRIEGRQGLARCRVKQLFGPFPGARHRLQPRGTHHLNILIPVGRLLKVGPRRIRFVEPGDVERFANGADSARSKAQCLIGFR